MGKRAGKKNKRGKRGGKRKASSIESTENSGDDMETNKTIDDTNTAVDEQSHNRYTTNYYSTTTTNFRFSTRAIPKSINIIIDTTFT